MQGERGQCPPLALIAITHINERRAYYRLKLYSYILVLHNRNFKGQFFSGPNCPFFVSQNLSLVEFFIFKNVFFYLLFYSTTRHARNPLGFCLVLIQLIRYWGGGNADNKGIEFSPQTLFSNFNIIATQLSQTFNISNYE